jgi:hypothetical protein
MAKIKKKGTQSRFVFTLFCEANLIQEPPVMRKISLPEPRQSVNSRFRCPISVAFAFSRV